MVRQAVSHPHRGRCLLQVGLWIVLVIASCEHSAVFLRRHLHVLQVRHMFACTFYSCCCSGLNCCCRLCRRCTAAAAPFEAYCLSKRTFHRSKHETPAVFLFTYRLEPKRFPRGIPPPHRSSRIPIEPQQGCGLRSYYSSSIVEQ